MKVTREVITDLLPAYLSKEASADTCVLIEEFFKQDPEFAALVKEKKTEGGKNILMCDMTIANAAGNCVIGTTEIIVP